MQNTVLGEQRQAPETHSSSVPHGRPQLPQLLASLSRSAHPVLQVDWPFGQVQAPLVQAAPGGQACPQAPQLAGSEGSETQAPSQALLPLGQLQWPPLQT